MFDSWTIEADGSRHAVGDKCMITAYDSYGRAAQHTDPRTSDFVLTELAGTTTIAFSDNYCHITGYSQLLALPPQSAERMQKILYALGECDCEICVAWYQRHGI